MVASTAAVATAPDGGWAVDFANNRYTVSWRSPKAGTLLVRVQTLTGATVAGSPFNQAVIPGPALATSTLVTGTGVANALPGLANTLTVVPRDQFGNAPAAVDLSVQLAGAAQTVTPVGAVRYVTYTASYTPALGTTGTTTLSVYLAGVLVTRGCPVSTAAGCTVTILDQNAPRVFDPTRTVVSGTGLTKGVAATASSGSFTVQMFDTNGVPWWPTQTTTASAVNYEVAIVSTAGTTTVPAAMTDNGAGTRTFTYQTTRAATYSVTVRQTATVAGVAQPTTSVHSGTNLVVRPAATSAAHSTLALAGTSGIQTGVPFTVTFAARDQFNNPQVYGADYPVSNDQVVLNVVGSGAGTPVPSAGFTYNQVTQTWQATSTVSSPGNYAIGATLGGVAVVDPTFAGSVLVTNSPLSAARSALTGDDGLTDNAVGARTFQI
eukprot:5479456-Pyramimonas_sp.AAC.1